MYFRTLNLRTSTSNRGRTQSSRLKSYTMNFKTQLRVKKWQVYRLRTWRANKLRRKVTLTSKWRPTYSYWLEGKAYLKLAEDLLSSSEKGAINFNALEHCCDLLCIRLGLPEWARLSVLFLPVQFIIISWHKAFSMKIVVCIVRSDVSLWLVVQASNMFWLM